MNICSLYGENILTPDIDAEVVTSRPCVVMGSWNGKARFPLNEKYESRGVYNSCLTHEV